MGSGIMVTDTQFSVREVPWHQFGNIVPDYPENKEEALNAAGLNWSVSKRSLYLGWTPCEGAPMQFTEANGCYATVRDDLNMVLGQVGENYTVYRNEELFQFCEDIAREGSNGEKVRWETAGSLWDSRRIWVLLRLPHDFEVGKDTNDIVASYLLVTSSHDGSASLTATFTPVRVVCNNTLTAALNGARCSYSLRHTESLDGRVKEARNALANADKYFAKWEDLSSELISRPVSDNQFKEYTELLWPDPKDKEKIEETRKATVLVSEWLNGEADYDAKGNARELLPVGKKRNRKKDVLERPSRLREIATNVWQGSNGTIGDHARGNAWGAFQSVAETEQYQVELDTKRTGRKPSGEAQFANSHIGEGLSWRRDALDNLLQLTS
jgi:phage/plasmid-like protein (TIGR03299 family)